MTKKILHIEVDEDDGVSIESQGFGDHDPDLIIAACSEELVTANPWIIAAKPWDAQEFKYFINSVWKIAHGGLFK